VAGVRGVRVLPGGVRAVLVPLPVVVISDVVLALQ
jgi:hypothetical protein